MGALGLDAICVTPKRADKTEYPELYLGSWCNNLDTKTYLW